MSLNLLKVDDHFSYITKLQKATKKEEKKALNRTIIVWKQIIGIKTKKQFWDFLYIYLKIDMMFVNFAWLMISSLVLKNMDHGSCIIIVSNHLTYPHSFTTLLLLMNGTRFGLLLYKHCTIDMPHNSCFESTIQISSMSQTQFCDAAKVAVIHRKI